MFKIRPLRSAALVVSIALLAQLSDRPVYATMELDRQYSLETVGFLKSWDNVDGLFEDYVSEAYRDYFGHQSRFVLQDIAKADTVLSHSKLWYQKLITDVDVLGQVARSTRSQCIIRTKVLKEGPAYRFTIDWMHAPRMDVIASESFTLENISDVRESLKSGMSRLVTKLPFLGHITGRDNNSVTVNIGRNSNPELKPGDTLNIATLDAVKKHPLLREIVEWRLTPTGTIQIDQVEDALSFGHITYEEPGRAIVRYQKITQIIPKTVQPLTIQDQRPLEKREIAPTSGWVTGAFQFLSMGRDYSTTGTSLTGGGLFIGGRAESQIWLTRTWFVEGQMGYGLWSHGQNDRTTGVATPASGVSGSAFRSLFTFGYNYPLGDDFFGPRAFVKLGYSSASYSLPSSVAPEFTTPTSFSSIALAIGGELPIRDRYGMVTELRLGLFPSASESPAISAAVAGSSDVGLQIGGYYKMSPRMRFRMTFEFTSNGADFTGGASTTYRTLTFVPALLYYF